MKPIIHSLYERPKPVQLTFSLPSLTEQHHKADCDINTIARRYQRTGLLPTNGKTPLYGDFTATPASYSDAVSLLRGANEWFEALPSNLRNRFKNDPERILQFMEDPANRKECEKLGLLPKLPAPIPVDDITPEGSPAEQAEA